MKGEEGGGGGEGGGIELEEIPTRKKEEELRGD